MSNEFFAKVDFQSLLKASKKSQRRQLQIIEMAIEHLDRHGLENFSFDHLSKECGITRSLIYHYFPSTTDLLLFTSAYIRFQYQSYVIEKMSKAKSLPESFQIYVEAALDWIDVAPKHARVWLLYFHKCATIPELAKHNQNLVDMGTARITGLLQKGIEQGVFQIPPAKAGSSARLVQHLITASLLARTTESRTPEDWRNEFNMIVDASKELVGLKPL